MPKGRKVSYRKLRHILIDRGMKKKDLEEAAGLTHYQMYKIANDKDITTDVIGDICKALNVEINDILEFVEDGDLSFKRYNVALPIGPDEASLDYAEPHIDTEEKDESMA